MSREVRDTLKILRERGYQIGLGSSSRNARFILEKTGLTDAFDGIADGTCISRSKPDPEVFLKAAELLKEDPEECLVVEDAEAGILAGIAAGMTTAATGSADGCRLSHYTLKHLYDLLEILPDRIEEKGR